MFIEAAVGGSLSQTVPAQFFKDFWNKPLDGTLFNSRAKPQIEQANFKPAGKTLNNLVFQALGSSFNRAEFVLCEKSINSFKERVWSLSSPMDDSGFKTYVEDGAKGAIGNNIFLSGLRTVGQTPSCPFLSLFC